MGIALLRKHGHSFWDQVGMTVSSVCFVHCVLTPVFVLALPWLGTYFEDPVFHVLIFVLVVPIGLYAFLQGYKHHRQKAILWMGLPGLLIVGLGTFLPPAVADVIGHEAVTVFGSVLLIAAHYLNRRICRTHRH